MGTEQLWVKPVRVDQTCFGLSGGLAPMSLPLFQGMERGALRADAAIGQLEAANRSAMRFKQDTAMRPISPGAVGLPAAAR
jgi:hypothetical protein